MKTDYFLDFFMKIDYFLSATIGVPKNEPLSWLDLGLVQIEPFIRYVFHNYSAAVSPNLNIVPSKAAT